MTDNVRKVFNMLGVEPNERFKIEGVDEANYYIDENLYVLKEIKDKLIEVSDKGLSNILNGYFKIIKLPKKKKLIDLTSEEWDKWKDRNCYTKCGECIFKYTSCILSCNEDCWIYHKDLYSDKFLNQEIEVEE